jgi:hypothetical protein
MGWLFVMNKIEVLQAKLITPKNIYVFLIVSGSLEVTETKIPIVVNKINNTTA